MITRPDTTFNGESHRYGIEGWADDDVVGVSSAAKIGQALEAFDIGSRWGYRLGYEGANEIYSDNSVGTYTNEGLRAALTEAGLTPWSKRDAAADRGTWVHDTLEALAQENRIPQLSEFSAGEVRGHVQSVLGWYVRYRPSFVATEVQVASVVHGFAGRYDMRCLINAEKLLPLFAGHETPMAERVRALAERGAQALCLVDLKTSKGIYPTSHFPQLALYEAAGTEMGFPETDCQLVLNSKPDGSTAVLGASWVQPDEILVFVQAYRAIKRIMAADPSEKLKRQRQEDLLQELRDNGPQWSGKLAELVPSCDGLDGRAIGRLLGGMRKRGLVEQDERKRWYVV